MDRMQKVEDAVKTLSVGEKRELLRRLEQQLRREINVRDHLPVIPSAGKPFSQREIDEVLDAD